MTTQKLVELRRLAEAVRDAELPHPKWLAGNAFKAALNYGTVIELLDALEAQTREIERIGRQIISDSDAFVAMREQRDTLRAEQASHREEKYEQ